MNSVRLQDVADLAGVSPKTVSRVINRESRVSPATREKVLRVVEELNYRPNKAAQSLAADRSLLIGLLYDNPSPAYITGLQEGVLGACDRHGYGLIIHPCDHQDRGLVEKLRALLSSTRLDGLVLTPPFTEDRGIGELLEEYGAPFVLISPLDQERTDPLVFTDDVSASVRMMKHLIDLGHRRIGFIRGLRQRSGSEMRYAGYRRALSENGIDFDPALVGEGEFTFEKAEASARQLLALQDPPTAIFASSDYMAAGVVKAAIALRIAVPEQLSVTGFDDNPIARYLTPTITTMRHPVKQLAENAGNLLISRLRKGNSVARQLATVPELVVRESCAPPCRGGGEST